MSVPEGKRGEQKLQVFIKAQELALYTTRICSNESIFKPQYYQPMTSKLVDISQDIFLDIWEANNIVVQNTYDYEKRHELQKNAHEKCVRLLALIQIATPLYHLTSKRVKHWGGLVIEVRNLIYKWKESDSKRYSN